MASMAVLDEEFRSFSLAFLVTQRAFL